MSSGSGSARSSKPGSLRLLPALAGAVLITAAVSAGCKREEPLGTAGIKTKGMPTMTTKNVMTIISDSGIPQYKLVCPLWLVYDNVDTPKWVLPGGPYLEKFDEKMRTIFTVACDSAVNNRLTGRWILNGNVEFKEKPGLLILTQQLIWDQREQLVYSDSFIHIEQPDKIIEGYGFEGHTSSSGKLTSYVLRRPTAVLPYDQSKISGDAGAIPPGMDPTAIDPSMVPPAMRPPGH